MEEGGAVVPETSGEGAGEALASGVGEGVGVGVGVGVGHGGMMFSKTKGSALEPPSSLMNWMLLSRHLARSGGPAFSAVPGKTT